VSALGPLTVIKVGGGLSATPGALDAVGAALGAAGRRHRLLVVPGGGPFADAVREFDRRQPLSPDAAHWMAILAMDQYAHVLADRIPGAVMVEEAGAVNGVLIAYVGLSPFVVTLGMLSLGRSLAVVLSQNKMIYKLGPGGPIFTAIGGGNQILGIANPVWVLLLVAIVFGLVLKITPWGRHLYAIGGNEQAARLTGVPVNRVKLQAYMISALTAAVSAILIVGWQGSAINALGQTYELRVIASTVIGGANLMGGEGGTYGAVIGAALIAP